MSANLEEAVLRERAAYWERTWQAEADLREAAESRAARLTEHLANVLAAAHWLSPDEECFVSFVKMSEFEKKWAKIQGDAAAALAHPDQQERK